MKQEAKERTEGTMTEALTVFDFRGRPVRTVESADGETFWIVKDVCDILGIGNASDVIRALEPSELASIKTRSGSQMRPMNAVNESGLYALIMRSRKPDARDFRKWVTSEVLPSIRRHGGYISKHASADQVAALIEDHARERQALFATVGEQSIELSELKAERRRAREALALMRPVCDFGEISPRNNLPRTKFRRSTFCSTQANLGTIAQAVQLLLPFLQTIEPEESPR